MSTYLLLSLAIITEVIATLLLKASNGWEHMWLGVVSMVLYIVSGVIFAFVLKSMNVGLAYAIWSGVGIALVCLATAFFWQQTLDVYALVGVTLIVVGTAIIVLKSSVVI